MQLLKERSSYSKASSYDIKTPFNPLDSHDSAKVSFFYDSRDSFELGLKPVYNDIYDISDGYLEGAYIDFFDLNLKKDKDEISKQRVKELDLKISSMKEEESKLRQDWEKEKAI